MPRCDTLDFLTMQGQRYELVEKKWHGEIRLKDRMRPDAPFLAGGYNKAEVMQGCVLADMKQEHHY